MARAFSQNQRVTGRTGDPWYTLARAKQVLRVTHAWDDERIQSLINSAVEELDGLNTVSGRCLGVQTWDVLYGVEPGARSFELKVPDVQTLVGVWQIDTETGVETAITGAVLTKSQQYAWLELPSSPYTLDFQSRPSVRARITVGIEPVPASALDAVTFRLLDRYASSEANQRHWERAVSAFRCTPATG